MLLGLLFAVYCLSGFDVGSHLSEETRRADKAPRMMVLSLVASFLLGLAFLLAILFSMQARHLSMHTALAWTTPSTH